MCQPELRDRYRRSVMSFKTSIQRLRRTFPPFVLKGNTITFVNCARNAGLAIEAAQRAAGESSAIVRQLFSSRFRFRNLRRIKATTRDGSLALSQSAFNVKTRTVFPRSRQVGRAFRRSYPDTHRPAARGYPPLIIIARHPARLGLPPLPAPLRSPSPPLLRVKLTGRTNRRANEPVELDKRETFL